LVDAILSSFVVKSFLKETLARFWSRRRREARGGGGVEDWDGGDALDVSQDTVLEARGLCLKRVRQGRAHEWNLEIGDGGLDLTLSFNDLL
jgi:hypothetical protein